MARRLGADPAYANRIGRNPSQPYWRTGWLNPRPHTLAELIEPLDKRDLRHVARCDEVGLGRNVDLFNDLRKFAYGEVVNFKRAGRNQAEWIERLTNVCRGMNLGFGMPLPVTEIRSIGNAFSTAERVISSSL